MKHISTILTPALRATLAQSSPLYLGARILHLLNIVYGPRLYAREMARRRRQALIDLMCTRAEGGQVAVVESGMDCDCVAYDGRVHIIDATPVAFDALDRRIAEWADGPYRLRIVSPSEAEHIHPESRDLVLEAHENGHPHHITY